MTNVSELSDDMTSSCDDIIQWNQTGVEFITSVYWRKRKCFKPSTNQQTFISSKVFSPFTFSKRSENVSLWRFIKSNKIVQLFLNFVFRIYLHINSQLISFYFEMNKFRYGNTEEKNTSLQIYNQSRFLKKTVGRETERTNQRTINKTCEGENSNGSSLE